MGGGPSSVAGNPQAVSDVRLTQHGEQRRKQTSKRKNKECASHRGEASPSEREGRQPLGQSA
jgi:hypothetical protein